MSDYRYHSSLTNSDLHPPKFLTGVTDPRDSGGPTPSYVGQIYFDTVNSVAYMSNNTDSNDDWRLLLDTTTGVELNQDVVQTLTASPAITTLTSGYLPYANATKQLVNSNMTTDGTNFTTTGTISAEHLTSTDDATITDLLTVPNINGSTADNGDLTLQGTSSATRTTSYVILQPTAGNVGIGTTSPATNLQVNKIVQDNTPQFMLTGLGNYASTPTDTENGVGIGLVYNTSGNRQFWIGDSSTGAGVRYINSNVSGWNYVTKVKTNITIGSAGTGSDVSNVVIGNNFSVTGTTTMNGNVGIGTTDLDGTPAIGRTTIKGSTNDGSTNILVGRDSDEANVATLDTNGVFTALGGLIIPSGTAPTPAVVGAIFLDTDASANGSIYCYANGGWRKVMDLP